MDMAVMVYETAQAAMTGTTGLYATDIYFSQFWRMEVRDQCTSMVGLW